MNAPHATGMRGELLAPGRNLVRSSSLRRPRAFRPSGPVTSMASAIAATGTLVPAFVALRTLAPAASVRIPELYCAIVARALGVEVRLRGELAKGSVLYVANHLSWLDILVLGARLEGAFVAKHEVRQMALVNTLARLRETIFVERERRSRAASQASEVATRLQRGGNVILFPEGTSNDGVRILPFKSTLFAGLDAAPGARVQPLTLAYTQLNGLPLTRSRLLELAWIGDMDLAPHALDMSRIGRVRAEIVCHPPVRPSDFGDRKALARHCHQAIATSYRRLVRGERELPA
ncbi:lysophospholipid acyltransferase family protein [Thermaurantiacus sp.]